MFLLTEEVPEKGLLRDSGPASRILENDANLQRWLYFTPSIRIRGLLRVLRLMCQVVSISLADAQNSANEALTTPADFQGCLTWTYLTDIRTISAAG